MKRWRHIALLSLMLIVVPTSETNAQLIVGKATDDIRIHEVRELLLFNSITQTQSSSFQVTFSGGSGTLGLILPVTYGSAHTLSTRSFLKDLRAIQNRRSLTQRKLEVSVESYLLAAIVGDAPLEIKTHAKVHAARSKSVFKNQDRPQVLKWAKKNGLYVSFEAVDALYRLEKTGFKFDLILLQTRNPEGRTRYQSPVVFMKRTASRPTPMPASLVGKQFDKHRLFVLSDSAYRIPPAEDGTTTPAKFRTYLGKSKVRKVLKSMPANLYTYKRAGYLQSFETDSEGRKLHAFIQQRVPRIVEAKETARYKPLRIIVPLELVFVVILGIIWAWNREKFSQKFQRQGRLRTR